MLIEEKKLKIKKSSEQSQKLVDKNETICIITPPAVFLLDERVFPHLGALKVAANLEKHGHSVDFIDLSGIENYLEMINKYAQTDTKIFGITASTSQIPAAVKISKEIRVITYVI